MANTLSDLMTNVLAKPSVANPVSTGHGAVYKMITRTAVLAADAAARLYVVGRLKASWRITGLWLFNDAIAGATDCDLGLYVAGDWSAADQTAKVADIYADGISVAVARSEMIDPAQVLALSIGSAYNVLGQGTNAITAVQFARQIWQDAGDSAEPTPGTQYDLAWIFNNEATGPGTLTTIVEYVAGY